MGQKIHLTKDQVDEIYKLFTSKAVKDSDFPATDSISAEDEITILQNALNKRITYSVILQAILDRVAQGIGGKGLSTEDFTTELKNKLICIESGAEVNILEGVKVNGVDLVIDNNKKVNVLVPDVSQFITKSVNNLVNYYLKNEVYDKDEIDELMAASQNFHYEVYLNRQMVRNPASNVLYLIGPMPAEEGKPEKVDAYQEWIYYRGQWKQIGEASLDLSDYITTEALAEALNDYQEKLVSGTNIKTINGQSIVGSGNLAVGDLNAVKFTSQTLTDAQKTQARTNIGAGIGNGTYSKPDGGIPKTDLASGVQSSLELADSSVQANPVGSVTPAVDPYDYATREELSQLGQEVNGINVNVGTWSVGSVNNPSGGHIPDYPSNRRMRTAELIIGQSATYSLKVNPGYKFGLIVVNKRGSLVWDSELSIDLAQGDVYRVVLREDPDPSNTNIYSGWTQTQINTLIAASGFQMFVKSSFDELKEELEAEINAVAISAIKSEQYCEIDVDVWPRPNTYIQDGLIFFLDGRDFTSGSWVDKVGNSSFALTDCVKDGNGVKFNGTSSHGTTDANLSFPSQQYTIEMVVKGEKEVSASSDSQIIFNTKNSGDFALGFNMAGAARYYTFQAGTTNVNLGYLLPSALGVKRLSVNKNLCVVNEEKITSYAGGANWNVGTKVTIGANASGNNWYFKGTIYAIRIYNRLLSESEMKVNQMFDKANYNL